DGDVHFLGVFTSNDFDRVTVEVQHGRSIGVPGRYNRGAPPVTALVVVNVPGDNWVVWVAGPVVLGVDLYAVTVWVAQVEVEGVGNTVAAWATFDGIRAAQGTQAVTDGQDVVLLVGCECNVVHAWAVATGHRGVVNGWFTTHPSGVDGAVFVRDFFGDAEAEVLHVASCTWDVWGDLVEVIQANQFAWDLQVVAPCEAFHVIDFVEEFVWEAQWVFNTNRVTDTADETVCTAFGAAAEFFVESFGLVDIFWGTNAVGEGTNSSNRALFQNQVVVDEFFCRAQVNLFVVFVGDVEAQDVDVEFTGCCQVGDLQFHVRYAQYVWCWGFWGRDGVVGVNRGILGHVETGAGQSAFVFINFHDVPSVRFQPELLLFAENWVVDFAQVDVNCLLIGVEVDRAVATLLAKSRGLDTTEWGAQVTNVVG